jgi:hypothetical protein
MLRKLIAFGLVTAAAATGMAAVAAATSTAHVTRADVQRANARYRDLDVATAAGFAKLLDANGVACIDMPGMGAMGVHYVNGTLVGDDQIDPLTPEALVYEPGPDGPHLVALEYVVFQSAWDAHHRGRPTLFGQRFNLTPDGNRFGLPAFYSLHAWLYKHNPAGTFEMWNPRVTCPSGGGDDGHVHST